MEDIVISDLLIYPIKSTKGISLNSTKVFFSGFDLDRNFGVVNSNNEMLTARENPKLLSISTNYNKGIFTFLHPGKKSINMDFNNTKNTPIGVTLFGKPTLGKDLNNQNITTWLSDVLEEPCKLIKIDTDNLRKAEVPTNDHPIYFSDCFPIHLITIASIEDLNNKLETKITDNRYRPNIIISGTKPYEEENWKSIIIGNCEFEVIAPAERCSLITINPSSLEIDKKQEPLRTLAKNRRGSKKVNFGVYLIPKNTGIIKKGDPIIINR